MLMNIHNVVMYGDVCVLTPQGSGHDQMIRITNVCVVSHNNECSLAHQLVPVSSLMKAVRNRAGTVAISHIQHAAVSAGCCSQRRMLMEENRAYRVDETPSRNQRVTGLTPSNTSYDISAWLLTNGVSVVMRVLQCSHKSVSVIMAVQFYSFVVVLL